MSTSQQLTPWLKPWIERLAYSLRSPDTQELIQLYLLDPVMTYIIERCFPYFLICGIIFGIIFILLIVTLAFLFIKLGGKPIELSVPDVIPWR
jgi:hypothetical protein